MRGDAVNTFLPTPEQGLWDLVPPLVRSNIDTGLD